MERFPLPLGAWDGLRYFIVALPEPSINYFASMVRSFSPILTVIQLLRRHNLHFLRILKCIPKQMSDNRIQYDGVVGEFHGSYASYKTNSEDDQVLNNEALMNNNKTLCRFSLGVSILGGCFGLAVSFDRYISWVRI